MKTNLIFLIFLSCGMRMSAQGLEVAGKVKILTVEKDNTADSVLVRLADGTLAVRDVDSLVQLQLITISNDTIFLTNGQFVKLPTDNVVDDDADASNEIQQLSASPVGDTLYLTDGGFLIIPGISVANSSIQERLNAEVTPIELYDEGVILDSLYGKIYAGGLIFHLDTANGTGFVAAPIDQSTNADWGCFGADLPAVPNRNSNSGAGAEIGDGSTNTAAILSIGNCPSASAALACTGFMGGGFPDWFLPSRIELVEMYNKIGPGAPAPNTNIGGFEGNVYWSSTEFNALSAWRFINGNPSVTHKSDGNHVRAVRTF